MYFNVVARLEIVFKYSENMSGIIVKFNRINGLYDHISHIYIIHSCSDC